MKRTVFIISVLGIIALMGIPSGIASGQAATETPTPTITPTPTATSLPINNGLISCWDLDETSGVRYDAFGSNHLTDNNTVGFAGGGIKGKSAIFIKANLESLSIADNPSLSISGDFTVAAWARFSSIGTPQIMVGKWEAGKLEYQLYFNIPNNFIWALSPDGSNSTSLSSTTHNIAVGEWVFVMAWLNNTQGKMYLRLNDLAAESKNSPGYTDQSSMFYLGDRTGSVYPMDGQLDIVSIWKRVLDSYTQSWLYNDGRGRSCNDLAYLSNLTPTPTVTPTITPTLANRLGMSLSSGDQFELDRNISYGDIAVVVALGVLVLVSLFYYLLRGARLWLR